MFVYIRIMEASLRDFEYIPLSSWSYEVAPETDIRTTLNHTQSPINPNQPSTQQSLTISNKESKNFELKKSYYSLQRKKHAKSRLFSEESNRDKRVRELNRYVYIESCMYASIFYTCILCACIYVSI